MNVKIPSYQDFFIKLPKLTALTCMELRMAEMEFPEQDTGGTPSLPTSPYGQMSAALVACIGACTSLATLTLEIPQTLVYDYTRLKPKPIMDQQLNKSILQAHPSLTRLTSLRLGGSVHCIPSDEEMEPSWKNMTALGRLTFESEFCMYHVIPTVKKLPCL